MNTNTDHRLLSRAKAPAIAICALLAALVFIVYGQTLRFDFVNYDDHVYVYENHEVSRGLTPGGVLHAFIRKDNGLWNPLVTISHMLDCQLYGLKAGGHHLTNVLLHLASTILLFLILRQMTGALWRCAFVAALFAIHPLRVESVAWISERKDVLSGLFFMLTLGAYLHYVRKPASIGRYLAVVLLFACGLMSKPMLVTLPFVLLLLDYWPLNRLFHSSSGGGDPGNGFSINWRAVLEKIPLLALSCGLCVATVLGPKETSGTYFEQVSFLDRIAEAPVWVVTYLGQMIWPAGLAVVYPHPEAGLTWWPLALGLLGLLSLGIFAVRRKHPALWMGWLWNLGMLVPVIGIVQISRHARADHYNYLPQIGLYIGLAWTVADWAGTVRRRRAFLAGTAAAALLFLLFAACKQTSYWRDSITLWTRALACTSDNFVAHSNYGLALQKQGRTEEAIVQYHEALHIYPALGDDLINLGLALSRKGRLDEAIALYRKALRADPANVDALDNLGFALFQTGRMDEAIASLHAALHINPAFAKAHLNLGTVLVKQGRVEEAVAEFHEALRLNPNDSDASENLGNALLDEGKAQEAIAQYHETLRMNPASAQACYDLGVALQQLGRAEEAVAEYKEALRINPAYADAHDNLGIMAMQQGRAEEGMAEFRAAVQSNPASPEGHMNLGKALLQQKQTGEAITEFRAVVRLKPSDAEAEIMLGTLLLGQGRVEEAIGEMRKALELQPGNATLENNLAWLLATAPQSSLRDGARAVQLAGQANQSTGGNNSLVLRTLAAAYAEAGEFPKAVQTAQNALQLAESQSNTAVAGALRRELKLYEAGQRYEDAGK